MHMEKVAATLLFFMNVANAGNYEIWSLRIDHASLEVSFLMLDQNLISGRCGQAYIISGGANLELSLTLNTINTEHHHEEGGSHFILVYAHFMHDCW